MKKITPLCLILLACAAAAVQAAPKPGPAPAPSCDRECLRGVITEYEIETVATRSRADGLIFDIDGLSAASEVMNYAPRPEQLASREDVLEAALHYPEGLKVYDGQIYAV